MSRPTRVLVSTLPFWGGGVEAMTRFALSCLEGAGYEPVVAYHQPYSVAPALSVPGFALGWKRPGTRRSARADPAAHEVGAWLPELEFMHYYPTRSWRDLVASCEVLFSCSGSCMAAFPLARSGRPFLTWIATPWRDDRLDRERRFGSIRRLWDGVLVRPVALRLERSILRARRGTVLALSEYTRRRLDSIAGRRVVSGTLPTPVDTAAIRPASQRVIPGRLGFSGRLGDPRKNVELFLHTVAALRGSGVPVTAVLVGSKLTHDQAEAVRGLGLQDHVSASGHLERSALHDLLPTLDVFMVPSRQEGLCIAALESMAAGCPVVSTRCGGPEEFVVDGVTGFQIAFDPSEGSRQIASIVSNRDLRGRLSQGARRLIERSYSPAVVERTFLRSLDQFCSASMATLDPPRVAF